MSNLLRPLCADDDQTRREPSRQIFAPENAALAQGLLRIILEEAHIEVFSPKGGGVALMRLERWQIELLKRYGIVVEPISTASQDAQLTQPETPSLQPEYIDFTSNKQRSSRMTLPVFSNRSQPRDILSDWLIDQ